MAKTYNDLYLDARRALRANGSENAQLEARELLSYVSGKSREQLYRDMPLYVGGQLEKQMNEAVQRRLTGEPVAYIVGEWDFYGLTLDITPEVLIPRLDTEVLTELAVQFVSPLPDGTRVLDLCAGSGCIGLAIAHTCTNSRVVLGEHEQGALQISRQNVRRCGLSARVTCLNVDALEPPDSTLWDFDLLVSNPPYIPSAEIDSLDESVRNFEPRAALDGGEDGLKFYRSIVEKWKPAIRLGGKLMLEVGYNQADSVEKLLVRNGYEKIKTHKDTNGIWRVVEGTLNH